MKEFNLISLFSLSPFVISMLSLGGRGRRGLGEVKGEPAARNTMRTKRKRTLCKNKLHDATNTSDNRHKHEILNFISFPAGATLMSLIFSVTDQGDKTNDDTERNGTKIHMSHSYTHALELKFVPAELRHSRVLIC